MPIQRLDSRRVQELSRASLDGSPDPVFPDPSTLRTARLGLPEYVSVLFLISRQYLTCLK